MKYIIESLFIASMVILMLLSLIFFMNGYILNTCYQKPDRFTSFMPSYRLGCWFASSQGSAYFDYEGRREYFRKLGY